MALALVAQATAFGEGFRIFGLVILPVVLFIGVGTTLRMGIANYHDAICVLGMNRIRAGYLEIAPDLGRFFVMGTTDDQRGMLATMAVQPRMSILVQMLASSPMLISIVNSVLAGGIVVLLVLQLDGGTALAIGASVAAFVLTIVAFLAYARTDMRSGVDVFTPIFPTTEPPAESPPDPVG